MIVWLLGIIVLLLPGCAVGPSYKQPKTYVPEKYSIDLPQEQEHVCWWKSFNNKGLEAAIEQGLQCNFDVRISLEKIEESRAMNRIDVAKILPQLDFFSDVLRANLGNGIFSQGLKNVGTFTSKFVAIDTLWEIDIWGRLRRTAKASGYRWQAQIEDMRDVVVMTAAEIARTYVALGALQDKITVVQDDIRASMRLACLHKDTLLSGVDAEQQYVEQEAAIATAQAQLVAFVIERIAACNKLAFLLGITPDRLLLDDACLQTVPLPEGDLHIQKPYELVRRRPDIRKAERLLAASYEDIGAAMAEWFPKISLLGFLGKPFTSGAGVTGGNEKLWAIGPLFGWPIIDFGRIYFNIKAKQSLQRQALLMYEKSVTNAVKEVESWLNAYVREKERANALYQKLSHAQRVLQLSQDLFAAGLEAEMVVLNNQKRVNSVRLELVDSQEKVAANFIALYKAFGGDW